MICDFYDISVLFIQTSKFVVLLRDSSNKTEVHQRLELACGLGLVLGELRELGLLEAEERVDGFSTTKDVVVPSPPIGSCGDLDARHQFVAEFPRLSVREAAGRRAQRGGAAHGSAPFVSCRTPFLLGVCACLGCVVRRVSIRASPGVVLLLLRSCMEPNSLSTVGHLRQAKC